MFIGSAYSEIITETLTWETEDNEETAQCYIQYDVKSYNVSYLCTNVKLSDINILDINRFRVAYTYTSFSDNKYRGYKVTDKPNGIPASISATGSVDHICKNGFTKRNGKCISESENMRILVTEIKYKYSVDSSYIMKLYNNHKYKEILAGIYNSYNYKTILGWYKFEKVKCFNDDMLSCDTLAKFHYEKGEYYNALNYQLKTNNRRSIGVLYELIGDSLRYTDEPNAIQAYKHARGYYTTGSNDYIRVDKKIPFELTSGTVAATLLIIVCIIAVIN